LSRSRLGFPVSNEPTRCSSNTGPRPLASSGSSFLELSLYFRVLPIDPARRASTTSTFHGVLLPFTTSTLRVHVQCASQAHCVPPSAFLTLSTVSSSPNLVGLFHPTAVSGIRLPGVFPATQPPWLVTVVCPHDVRREDPIVGKPTTPVLSTSSPRRCSKQRSVTTREVFTCSRARSPLRLPLLRVCPSLTLSLLSQSLHS
jgi:hypothetical protein